MHTMCRGRLQKQPHIGAQSVHRPSRLRGRGVEVGLPTLFCHGDEENGHRACTNGHLTTADQRQDSQSVSRLCNSSARPIHKAYLRGFNPVLELFSLKSLHSTQTEDVSLLFWNFFP